MNNNWKVVTGEDGQQYYEVSGQVYLSPNTMSPNQDGAAFVAIPVPETRGFGMGFANLAAAFDDTAVAFQRWLPGDPDGGSQSAPPAGRFQNLDFS